MKRAFQPGARHHRRVLVRDEQRTGHWPELGAERLADICASDRKGAAFGTLELFKL